MHLVFLPAYSPDLNPIEEVFSAIKAWIRANRDYVLGEMKGGEGCDLYKMIWDAVFTVTPEKALGWFRHSGYTVLIQPSLQSRVTQAHEVKRFFELSCVTTGFEENFGGNLMVTLKKSACGTKI
jgi:hypothetical protein